MCSCSSHIQAAYQAPSRAIACELAAGLHCAPALPGDFEADRGLVFLIELVSHGSHLSTFELGDFDRAPSLNGRLLTGSHCLMFAADRGQVQELLDNLTCASSFDGFALPNGRISPAS